MTYREALLSVSAYPIPQRTIEDVAHRRGLQLDREITAELLHSASCQLARAELLMWLSYAPNVSQGGQSYSFSDSQRESMRNEAQRLFDEFSNDAGNTPTYGYKGSRL